MGILLAISLAGCGRSVMPTTRPAMEMEPITATPQYWYAQPAVSTATHDDYEELWIACKNAPRWYGFTADRMDYRDGLLVSRPLVSKQVFEFWRRDVTTLDGVTESTLATVRRIVRFELKRAGDQSFECVPKVLVERYSSSERRITSVTQYRESFAIESGLGSRERDEGRFIPETYWYAVGRDEPLERRLGAAVQARVGQRMARR